MEIQLTILVMIGTDAQVYIFNDHRIAAYRLQW